MNVATARLDATEATHNGKRVREHKLHWRKTMKARAAVAVGRPAPAPLDNEDSGCHARGGGDGGGVDQMQKLLRSSVLLDTRSSQHLEPIRLPGKLRDRIEKAQRRAAAAKDGALWDRVHFVLSPTLSSLVELFLLTVANNPQGSRSSPHPRSRARLHPRRQHPLHPRPQCQLQTTQVQRVLLLHLTPLQDAPDPWSHQVRMEADCCYP